MFGTQFKAINMIKSNKFVLLLAGASLAFVTACDEPGGPGNPNDPNRNTRQGVIIGGLVGATVGALTNSNPTEGIIKGGVIGAAGGGLIGSGLDKQERDLRNSLGNDNIRITNTGDRLIVSLPQDILFATDSFSLRPALQNDLRAVARNLQAYPNSTVQVVGHTDNVGAAAYNQELSQRRAGAVAGVLVGSGVAAGRILTVGRGEDQPIASNLSPEGRAQNRRVEIVILPN
jgi:outer membrane protein OmpA-like peptidoglycan-associated protein